MAAADGAFGAKRAATREPAACLATFKRMWIAHLSDPHLMRGPLAAQPAANLAGALGRLLAIEPRPGCVVITGDLADTGHPEEYAALRTILRRCPVPVHLMTGNHDDPSALVGTFGDTPFLADGVSTSYVVEYPEATIVVADSWLAGSPAGQLGPDQLAWIDRTLAARPGVPAFVCLHHPPRALGIPFLDGIMLTDAVEFGAVIRRHPHVVRVLVGHVHRDVSALFAGTLMTAAPSTFRQSALRMQDAEPPGYLAEPTSFLAHLLDGADCVTHSVAVSHAAAVRAF
jgi:3',5'-cyclic AMP phosphodiesterase CpdA